MSKIKNSDVAYFSYDTECFGKMWLGASERGLVSVSFYQDFKPENIKELSFHKTASQQLNEYFSGNRKTFDLPLDLRGTDFQKKVWLAIKDLPYGQTSSYKQIAEQVGCPKGSRAVGLANNKNPIPIICACHRVIGSNGSLTGYAYGLEMKEKLIKLESVNSQ